MSPKQCVLLGDGGDESRTMRGLIFSGGDGVLDTVEMRKSSLNSAPIWT